MDASTLRDDIEGDIESRLSNLTSLRTMSSRYSLSSKDKDAMHRCAIPIIYAEWEGFFSYAMSLYFREINKLGLKLDELDSQYYVLLCEKSYPQLQSYPEKLPQRQRFLNSIKMFMRNTNAVSFSTKVNTESNLGFKVMNSILHLYKIEMIEDHINHDSYSLKDAMDKFLTQRNGLAHGDPSITASEDDITVTIQLVEIAMEHVKENIIAAAEMDVYRLQV